jgi:hypothetical protein
MRRSGRTLHEESISGARRSADYLSRPELRTFARGATCAGAIALGLLLMSALAGAATQDVERAPEHRKPTSAAASAAAAQPRVSPYAMANRRRAEASRAVHSPVPLSMRRPHRAARRGQSQ